jgi:ankyrin repeat protein
MIRLLVVACLALGVAGCRRGDGTDVGARVNARTELPGGGRLDIRSATPLHQAAAEGRDEDIVKLLEADAEPNAQDASGRTPLVYAALSGSQRAVYEIESRGGRVDHRDDAGNTPLHYAAMIGDEPVAALLLTLGANAAAANDAGLTPLHYAAAASGLPQSLTSVYPRGMANPGKPDGAEATVRRLLDEGGSADAKDAEHRTPLHFAAAAGARGVIQVLLAAGAERGAEAKGKKVPADYARQHGHPEAASLLTAP